MKLQFLNELLGSIVCSAVIFQFGLTSCAQDWPRFRGPDGLGVVENVNWSGQITEQDQIWKLTLSGRGVSSPVIWRNHVYITSADEESGIRYLACVQLEDGKELWEKEFSFTTYKKHKNNGFAASTPVLDQERVYVLWQSRDESTLHAYTHQGEEAWSINLGAYTHGQGAAASPVIHNGMIFIANDQKEPSFLLAADCTTGKELWRIPRLGQRACYASPGVLEHGPQSSEIIFSHCYEGVSGVDPGTGEVLWNLTPFGEFSQRAICSPFILPNGLIIAGSGAQGGERIIVALRRQVGNTEKPIEEVFRVTRGAPHVPTPVSRGNLLYLWADLGIVTAVDIDQGKKVWQHRTGGNYFSSPICIDNYLLNIDTDGNLVVLNVESEPEEICRLELGEESRSTPACSGQTLVLRTQQSLYGFRLQP